MTFAAKQLNTFDQARNFYFAVMRRDVAVVMPEQILTIFQIDAGRAKTHAERVAQIVNTHFRQSCRRPCLPPRPVIHPVQPVAPSR